MMSSEKSQVSWKPHQPGLTAYQTANFFGGEVLRNIVFCPTQLEFGGGPPAYNSAANNGPINVSHNV